MNNFQNRDSWNTISRSYQGEKRISLQDVHYGPVAPGERKLNFLGDVKGKRILELGCGGGQNSIVLTKWGAEVIGLDISDIQLEHANTLAKEEGVRVQFVQGRMEDLERFKNNTFDIVISSHAIGYADDLKAVYKETARVLKPEGFLVFCFEHPIYLTIGSALEEWDFKKVKNYFDRNREEWDWSCFDGTIATFNQGNWSIKEIINDCIEVGLHIIRIEEPQAHDIANMDKKARSAVPYISAVDETHDNYFNKFVQVIRIIPFSLILKAKKS
ncbi:MAG: methyltransferase domain-containing protein [Candidatus Heimdallarchaeota archaeon]|nr:MAG: methyltransferase domain-containing protein [Candidatus Heimdallarchaeota archaeon]